MRTSPTHLLLRSNQRTQSHTVSFTNAGLAHPVTFKLGHRPAAAVSLKDSWFVTDPELLLKPLAAGVSYAVGGRPVGEVVVPAGGTVQVQVRGAGIKKTACMCNKWIMTSTSIYMLQMHNKSI